MTDTPQRTDQDVRDLLTSKAYAAIEYISGVAEGAESTRDDAATVNRKFQAHNVLIAAWAKTATPAVKGPYGHQSEQELTPAERVQKLREFLRKPDAELAEAMAAEGLMMKAKGLIAKESG